MSSAPPTGGQQIQLSSLSAQQLSQLKKQLDSELTHLTTSYQSLARAQAKFRDCLASLKRSTTTTSAKPTSPADDSDDDEVQTTPILVPLTSSLYVPGRLPSILSTVIVDVGTGFYVEKSVKDAENFYSGKVEDLGRNLKELGKIVESKEGSVGIVESALREKVMARESSGAS
ncbi:hypothetical protein K402DRAFT_391085 [Aulographum hederae CBS 113979]|uniref:Prefoldin alpha subunit n=1 Tax=Aulographum hederae CBS 113979 TaxID=1176131 RepID=A0A6G1H8H9_9PEZI|nr:hypothetical protein K402DRAFT_391085 [Aulographum hederae CBS 113979]